MSSTGRARLAICTLVSWISSMSLAHADTWTFPPEHRIDEFRFGETTIVRGIDSTTDSQWPRFYVEVHRGGQLIARYPGVSFTGIAASKDNRTFVAVSNRGLSPTALLVFDANGEIKALLNHYQGGLIYCDESATIFRLWYWPHPPEIEFEYDRSGNVTDIMLQACTGQQVRVSELTRMAPMPRREDFSPFPRRLWFE